MECFKTCAGIVAPLDLPNVDTDQIIPKQFLKRIERTGFGPFLFYDWRFLEGLGLNPDFEMNQPRYRGATILLTQANFGCGSSREHAPWALLDYGIRCIIAPSFADIFYNNCFKNGMLPITTSDAQVTTLFHQMRTTPGYTLTVDLVACRVTASDGLAFGFDVDPFRRHCLLNGLDDIELTLQHVAKISAYEAEHFGGAHVAPSPSKAG